jgi:hypothetical protein
MATPDKSAITPKKLERIYDVVAAAGIDVSAWHKGSGEYSTNPNFCYRWAFVGDKTALLCLWVHAIEWVDGGWVCEGNAREDQIARAAAGADHWDSAVRNRTKRWANSAQQMEEVLKDAYRNKLEVRVCIVATRARATEFEAATADFRALDPIPWNLTYDMMTGNYVVRRSAEPHTTEQQEDIQASEAPLATSDDEVAIDPPHESIEAPALPEITATSYGVGVVDQFVINENQRDPVLVERYERERSAVVRQLVMARSNGCCEWCGQPGFKKHDGQIYLESHHVVPLYQDGDDTIENVIALCPNDHRMAHFGEHRDDLAIEMLIRVEERLNAACLQGNASQG